MFSSTIQTPQQKIWFSQFCGFAAADFTTAFCGFAVETLCSKSVKCGLKEEIQPLAKIMEPLGLKDVHPVFFFTL